ncbi:NAD-dependent succinate-semialdehyde dehydrogenase [Aliivibrio kagoshimensis]|uniref:NAD-dependent succinate-semialdehyde dehydrogenase n=1 Tax=Aliivibrio kagoshimensis TaxID=2910230 RepID=UPI003D0C1E1A
MKAATKLMQTHAYIDGEWVKSRNDAQFPVYNPATGDQIAQVPDLDKEDAVQAIYAAERAFQSWKKTSPKQRSALLKGWYQLIMDQAEHLATLMTTEQGKPYQESYGEVLYGASFIEWFAEEAKRGYGDTIPAAMAKNRYLTIKQPVGVVVAITPWNFPLAMITRKVGPALAAGCTVVVKPGEDTPLTALALAKLAEEAGIPAGVINIVTTRQVAEVGELLCTHPAVRKVSFTGSTAVGKHILRQAADTVKKVSMELGGNAPCIVFDDADLDKAVQGALISKYRNAGQTCVCTNRLYVHDAIYDQFISKYTAAVMQMKVGNGLTKGTDIGPLINEKAVAKVTSIVEQAIEQGASLLLGGHRSRLGDCYYEPTILSEVNDKMDIAHQEIFGPVTTVFRFNNEAEVVEQANATPYGLAAYFYTQNFNRIWRVSEALEYGMVGINEGIISTEMAPFGGVKESGSGREGSKYGLDDYLEIKYLCMNIE